MTGYTVVVSHTIYHTEAMVLGIRNTKESNRIAILYTRDFGLIYVGAISVRKNEAKMRYHLQYVSLVGVDLVRGRDFWRLTGIHEQVASLSFVDTPWYQFFDRVASVISRLCHGEDSNERLWREITDCFELAANKREFHPSYELIFLIRILSFLGYWNGDEIVTEAKQAYHQDEVLSYVERHRKKIVEKINTSLRQTQL